MRTLLVVEDLALEAGVPMFRAKIRDASAWGLVGRCVLYIALGPRPKLPLVLSFWWNDWGCCFWNSEDGPNYTSWWLSVR